MPNALNDSTFNVNQLFALLLLDNTSQIKKKMEVRRSTNNFVLCMLERVWPQLNWVWILKQNFKNFVPWKLKSAAPNELKTSRSMFYGRRNRKNQKRRFNWFSYLKAQLTSILKGRRLIRVICVTTSSHSLPLQKENLRLPKALIVLREGIHTKDGSGPSLGLELSAPSPPLNS